MKISEHLYKQGPNGYAMYKHKGNWRESAVIRNGQLKPISDCLFGITGTLNHGKNTLAGLLNQIVFEHSKTEFAFGDEPKRLLHKIFPMWTIQHFYDRELKETVCPFYGISPRIAMTTFATGWMREQISSSRWIAEVEKQISNRYGNAYGRAIITDVRFNNEATCIKDKGGIIVRIKDPRKPDAPEDEPSEAGIADSFVDIDIENTGTIDDLAEKITILKDLFYLPK